MYNNIDYIVGTATREWNRDGAIDKGTLKDTVETAIIDFLNETVWYKNEEFYDYFSDSTFLQHEVILNCPNGYYMIPLASCREICELIGIA